MLSKSKRFLVEAWILVDFALFDDHPSKVLTEDKYKEYLTSKSSFLFNLFEIYNVLQYKYMNDVPYNNKRELFDYAEDKVELCEETVKDFLKTDKMQNILKEEVKGFIDDKNKVSEHISDKYKALLLDEILIRECFENAEERLDEKNRWKFKLLYNSHSIFRDNLINTVR